jgi:LacI family transcriptional regulator
MTKGTVGLLIGDLGNPFYAQLATAITRSLDDEGWACLVTHCSENSDIQAMMADQLVASGVRGLIATEPHSPEVLSRVDVPVVAVDRTEQDVPFVASDGEHGGRLVAAHLIEAGYRRCGVVYAEPETWSVRDRLTGFRLGLQGNSQAQIEPNLEIDCGVIAYDESRSAAKQLIEAGADAIFAINDYLALGVLAAVADAGRRPGQDVGVVGFDDTSVAGLPNISLTSVAQGIDQLAARAAGMLVQRITRPQQQVPPVILRPRLIARDSTRRSR